MFGAKHRPENFSDVIGLEAAKEILKNSLAREPSVAYMFAGSHGIGKTTIARIMARSILCKNRLSDGSPCNECESCTDFLSGRHGSYFEVDAGSKSGKEDIKGIVDALSYQNSSGRMIVLLDECHRISDAGKDALLKVLEEDGDYTFMFCTTAPEKMPATLASRCMRLMLPKPSTAQVAEKLAIVAKSEGVELGEDSILRAIAEEAEGHYRDAENLLESVALLGTITYDNLNRVRASCRGPVLSLVLNWSKDLSACLSALDELVAIADMGRIRDTIVRVLVDASKIGFGVVPAEEGYAEMLTQIQAIYRDDLSKVLEFILTKDRMTSRAMLESDVILVHYKFLRGEFESSMVASTTDKGSSAAKADSKPKKEEGEDKFAGMSTWERDIAIRKIRAEDKKRKKDSTVEEKISSKWGPETPESGATGVEKKVLSEEEFLSGMKEAYGSQRI